MDGHEPRRVSLSSYGIMMFTDDDLLTNNAWHRTLMVGASGDGLPTWARPASAGNLEDPDDRDPIVICSIGQASRSA